MDLRRVKEKYKASLKKRFEKVSEVINKEEAEMLLSEIYTELYITEGEHEGVNIEHEVLQVELTSTSQTTKDTPIKCNDIFKSLPGKEKHRTVMTKGIAGIGKTVAVQKFILDWTDEVANEDIDFMFSFPFRELNLVKDNKYSLHKLLHAFHPELKDLNDSDEYKDLQVVFIFDGLDESQFSINYQQKTLVSDVQQISTIDVLLLSLIQGTLLPSAFIWITSRPAASSQIPVQYVKQVTEIRGFNDHQKEEYFRKRINDESLSNRIISHIKLSRSLHIMCHIPVFCWIAATVLKQMLEEDNTKTIPKTLTEMYIHFLLIQITRKNQKDKNMLANKEQLMETQEEIILKLADLAFRNLENHKVMFYEEDLRECNIDVSKNTVFSGLCTEILKEESGFNRRKVYCFVHLSFQEFLAAFHIIMSYSYQKKNMGTFFSLEESLKFAVARCVEGRNGHMDLFLRFLLGMSLESNQRLLGGFLKHTCSSSESIKETCRYIKELNKDLSPERCINLFHCLIEMNDHSVLQEIERFLESPDSIGQELSPAHCSALAHILLMSEKLLDVFDLKKYNTSDEGRKRLLPAVRCFKMAQLQGCKLNQMSCETVKRSLQSANSLTHLDLSHNALENSGVQILSAAIRSPSSKLQIFRLCDCKISGESCETLATVLQSPNSLIELDLSHNDLGDSGVHILLKGLANPECKLQILRLAGCLISEEGCECLASALTSNPSHLNELDLSYNHPGKSGLKLISARLKDPLCKLSTLNTDHCAEIRLRPGVQKYACELTVDPNSANGNVLLTEENRKMKHVTVKQPYPDHPDRFDMWPQVLCREGLSGRCYWEAECSGPEARIAVTYKGINRKGKNVDSLLGRNTMSWTLYCSGGNYFVWHNNVRMDIPAPSSDSRRVGVYLDCSAGTLSFYSVSSDTLTHLHTFHSTFTEPIYPGFYIWPDSPVSLCQIT